MPDLGTASIGHIHRVLHPTPGPIYTSAESNYSAGLLPKIVIKSLDKTQILYSFDPFTYGNNAGGATYCSVGLGTNQHGQFEVEFEAENKTVDDTLVKPPARCYIYFGKSQSQFKLVLSGMIRRRGYLRGCENNLLYHIAGYGTGIRSNERILDVNEAPTKTLRDGVTIDTTDSDFFARNIIDDSVDDGDYYPENITSGTKEGGGSAYDYLNSSGTLDDSNVKDFIPGIQSRFQEIGDVWNQVEDYTGARASVDTDDRLQLQPLMTPLSSNTGFIITTTPNMNSDLAANTMYIEEDYSWDESIQNDSGWSSGLYGILPSDPVPQIDHFTDNTFSLENDSVEIAQRFRPPTNPNWRIFAAVESIGMTNVESENSVRGRWRIAEDDNGKPLDVGGIVANKFFYPNLHYNTGEGGMQTVQVMGEGNADLDVNKYYWLILSSTNATAPIHWRWFNFRLSIARGESMTASPGTSDDNDAGTGWTATPGYLQMIVTTRFKAEPFVIQDQKAIDENILIESVASSFPQQITSKLAANKYLLGLAQYAVRPRRIYNFPSLTIPNNPVLPGDIAYIVDPRFNFSTSGNPVTCGTITDLQYSFGQKNAGTGPSSKGMRDLSLNVVGYNQFY